MLVRHVTAAALLAGFFVLQLPLVGTGEACAMEGHETPASPSVAAGASDAEPERTTEEEGCCAHPVSRDQCRTMAPCGAHFTPADAIAQPRLPPMPEAVAAALVTMPPSVLFPPERRPPRA